MLSTRACLGWKPGGLGVDDNPPVVRLADGRLPRCGSHWSGMARAPTASGTSVSVSSGVRVERWPADAEYTHRR